MGRPVKRISWYLRDDNSSEDRGKWVELKDIWEVESTRVAGGLDVRKRQKFQ